MIIQLQIRLEISLYSKSISSISLIKISLRCSILAGLHTNMVRILVIVQSAGAVEYTDCFSAEG